MDTIATRNVNQIPAEEKRTLESLLGSALEPEQNVLILTYTPGQLSGDEIRQAARARIAETLAVNQKFATVDGICAAEADAAIEEALSIIRHCR